MANHSDLDVVADFEMQVGGIHSKVVADRSNLLAAFDQFPILDHDLVEVAVERVAVFDLAVFGVAVGVAG